MSMVPPCSSGQLAFLQPLLGSRKTWSHCHLENCHRFFLPTPSRVFAEWLPHISGTGVFFTKLAVLLDFMMEAKYTSLFLEPPKPIWGFCCHSMLGWAWGNQNTGSLLRDLITSVANFIALLSILKSFFSLTFKHMSSIIIPFSQFCCFNMDFKLWELHVPTF